MTQQTDIPTMLDVAGKRCVVVGAGTVGARRVRVLSEAGARVVLIALQVHHSIRLAGVEIVERAFEPRDLDRTLLAVAATDIPEINEAVSEAAKERHVLINRADDASKSDFTFMSSYRNGPLTVAVHTGGASANAAVQIRDLICSDLDSDWGGLLAVALEYRREIQRRIHAPAKRLEMLQRLSDAHAMAAYKAGGESTLRAFYDDMMGDLV